MKRLRLSEREGERQRNRFGCFCQYKRYWNKTHEKPDKALDEKTPDETPDKTLVRVPDEALDETPDPTESPCGRADLLRRFLIGHMPEGRSLSEVGRGAAQASPVLAETSGMKCDEQRILCLVLDKIPESDLTAIGNVVF
ncbi:hypothetical protein B6K86_07800 [Lachnospiraceae bacterium]|nr:hypothetical protein B6K86_07800 [Lachnospiraceae bacterium]